MFPVQFLNKLFLLVKQRSVPRSTGNRDYSQDEVAPGRTRFPIERATIWSKNIGPTPNSVTARAPQSLKVSRSRTRKPLDIKL